MLSDFLIEKYNHTYVGDMTILLMTCNIFGILVLDGH